ncbi:gliding motility-associated C-terminal domain-containing protein [Algoriphagus sp. CAU 1675]|uniref:DUF7507 domain-containing protein n=1 Tax=Algoriphagus sp. CAU 1675 TaxID=3032597 RepID=UPI0023DBF3F2|nr:gliding motility-associated C-terminal domain-containing protein [Algoriphagus sp. CAU 1675]MDF2159379.1 gliding motility-associated C-terminal domain-containing protein [Algoriphagus sp. CAU 1675]
MILRKNTFLTIFLIFWGILAFAFSARAQNDYRVPFKHRVGSSNLQNNIYQIRGDFSIIGNTNLTLENYREDGTNSLEKMRFVDIDDIPNTFNSSSATLVFSEENGADPNCTEIIYAGLYWSGRTLPGLGLNFELTKRGGLDEPVTLDQQETVLKDQDSVDFLPYKFFVIPNFDENGLIFPQYELISNDGTVTIIFRFTAKGEVIYSINNESWVSVEDLQIVNQTAVSTSTFKPITFSFEGLNFSIGQLTRSLATEYDEFVQGENSLQLITSGTYRPYIYYTEQFDKRKLKFKPPGATDYLEVTADGNAIFYPQEELYEIYVGYADVTDLVKSSGSGEYTVADIALTEGLSDEVGYFGNWGLIVVYQNSKMNLRDVTIFDGYTSIAAWNGVEQNGEIEIQGFGAVKEGPVSLKLGIMASEGDKPIGGDFLEIQDQKGDWVKLNHPLNTPENFFNSSIYTPVQDQNGVYQDNPRTPFLLNNTGIDIVQWEVPNPDNTIIANNQNSAKFRYGTSQDLYTLYALAFSVLSYSPNIEAHNYIKSINGAPPTDTPTVQPGEEIIYQVDLRNVGTESTVNSQLVIPIPYNAVFVSAEVIPSSFGTVRFDPTMGIAGSIIWEIGDIPILENVEDIIASLEYRLKLTEDCFVLANDNCDARLLVNGSISGTGSISNQPFSNLPFIKEYMEGLCAGNAVYGPIEVPISGKAEFAALHCPDFMLFTELNLGELPEFCLGDPPSDLSELIPPSQEDFQVYFFSEEIGGTPLPSYYVNTSQVGSETIWVSEGPEGSCTGMRIPLTLTVNPKSPEPYTEDLIFCMEEKSLPLTVDATPGYTVYYYPDNDPSTPPMTSPPIVDLSKPKEYSIWVSQGTDGACESDRKEVKIIIEDCSLFPEIAVSISADLDHFTKEGEIINFTILVKNTGGITLFNVNVNEFLGYNSWSLPSLEPGEEQSFTFPYSVSSYNIFDTYIFIGAEASGWDRKGEYVFDNEQLTIPGIIFPPGFLDYSVSTSAAECQEGDTGLGQLIIQWTQNQSGSYKITDLNTGQELNGEFENKNQIIAEVPAGDYSVELMDLEGKVHAVPDIYSVEKRPDVQFEIPAQVTACGEYLLIPESEQALIFSLIAPDGSTVSPDSNGAFSLTQTGTYQIKGMDSNQEMCPVGKSFEASIIQPSELELELRPFCSEDSSTTLTLLTDPEGHLVQWYSLEASGEVHLSVYDNSSQIIVDHEGKYRVTLTDAEGCLLGEKEIQVTQSFTDPPVLGSLYTICTERKIEESIDPGSRFSEFSWILDGEEVSSEQIFAPNQAGSYTLIAKDPLGCAYFADFVVEDKCEPELRYPNAMRLGDPGKGFEIYPDNLADELAVSIFNRWGQLIYFCEDKNPENGVKSSCYWDGTFNNETVPNGTYVVLITIKNFKMGSTKVEKGSILVLD